MRKFLFFILFIVIGLSYLFEVDELIIRKLSVFNDIKNSYINKVIDFSTTFEKYFNQASAVERLTQENNELRQYKSLYIATQKKLDTLKEEFSLSQLELNKNPDIELAKVLSYIKFNDFTKVWLDIKKVDDKIHGLITGEYAAGIVINENNKSVALLNGNKKCSYAVFIGKNKVPGIITSSKDGKNLTIQFIPVWSEIKEGDEVITSGMDNIFFEGLKVGKILKVSRQPDMQIALLKPYADVLEKKYFYVYKHKEKAKEEISNN